MVAGAVVRLWSITQQVVGGGFLVGPDLIASCAHVVAEAIGADPYSATAPKKPVSLDFPLIRDEAGNPTRLEAVIERWSPIGEDGSGDLALLRLTRAPPPQAGMPPLRRIERLWDHRFRVLGFPAGRAGGVWSTGVIRGEQGTRWFQLQSTAGEQRIEGGFSGAPVWDAQSGAVVGMTVAIDRGDTTTAYLIPINQVLGLDPALLPCPYRGLRPFEEEHAATFFGRNEEIDKLLDALKRMPVVAVAGPSGAGKSSLLRAGLLPRLRARGAHIIDLRAGPGTDLVAELEAARTEAGAPGSVVVVDQFEELAVLDPAGARRLLERIVRRTGTEPVRAVLTVRWAALDEVLTPELIGVLEKSTVLVAPMNRTQLREAIVGPAERSPGLAFEPGLVDRILDDAGAEPGQLPLVESLLTDLWDRRDSGYLTIRGYEAAGGVAGALARHAERALDTVGSAIPDTLRQLFTALARPDRDGRFGRRAVPLGHLPAAQRALVPALADARLLVVGRAGLATGSVVELAHQALIDHWPRLRTWLAQDQAFLAWREQVDTQRARWEAEGRANTALLRGATLAAASDWLPARVDDLSPASLDYLRRSTARQRWEVRRWRMVTAVLAVLAVTAVTLSLIAVDRRQVLASHLATANANTLARESQNRASTDIALAAQLALAAWHADPKDPQARSALANSYLAMRSVDTELANLSPTPITQLELAGDRAIIVGPPRMVALTGVYGPTPGQQELPDTSPRQESGLSHDGRWLANVTPDRTAVQLRDLASPAKSWTLPSTPGVQYRLPSFAPNGDRLMWFTIDAAQAIKLTVWDLHSNVEIPHKLGPLPADTQKVWLTTDPNLVLVETGPPEGSGTRLVVRSLVDGAEVATMPAGSAVVRDGAAVASCEPPPDGSAATVTVTPIGGTSAALRIRSLDSSCSLWLSADGGALIERYTHTDELGHHALRLTDLSTGTARHVVVPAVKLSRPSRGFAVVPTLATGKHEDQLVVFLAHHSSMLRLRTQPVVLDENTSPVRKLTKLTEDGRYLASVIGDTLIVQDRGTGQRLATVPGAAEVGTKVDFDSAAWVFSPESHGWTVTCYDFPALRRTASYRLPVSANPRLTALSPLAGQDVAAVISRMSEGWQMLSISDGVLATLDPSTGRPLGTPITLGTSPLERTWFQIAPLLDARPQHPGQAIVTDAEGGLQVWDAVRGQLLATIPTAYRPRDPITSARVPKFAVDPTGTQLALLTPAKTIEVWNIDTATSVRSPIPAPQATKVVGFDADGYLVLQNELWLKGWLSFVDLDQGQEAGSMALVGTIDSVVADGSAVRLQGSVWGPPEQLALTAQGWHDKLCSITNRPFTPAELAILPPGTGTGPPCS